LLRSFYYIEDGKTYIDVVAIWEMLHNGSGWEAEDVEGDIRLYYGDREPLQLSRVQENELARRASQGDVLAYQKLAEAKLQLVFSVAKNYIGYGVPFLDLVQEGTLALQHAISIYGNTQEESFHTLAYQQVHRHISKTVAQLGCIVSVTLDDYKLLKRIYAFATNQNGEVTFSVIADAVWKSQEAIESLLAVLQPVVSLDMLLEEQEEWLEPFLSDKEHPGPEEIAEIHLRRELIELALGFLTERQQHTIILRYGLWDDCVLTLLQMSSLYGVTQEAIRSRESEALNRLRDRREIKRIWSSWLV